MDFDSALKVAVARLGIEELKDKQKEAIESFASGKDVFVALPTGYGKVSMLPGLAYSIWRPSWPSDTDLDHSSSDSSDIYREGSSIEVGGQATTSRTCDFCSGREWQKMPYWKESTQ